MNEYLVIWEDNTCWQCVELPEEVKRAALDGLCQVLKFSRGEFHELAVIDPEEWVAVAVK